MNCSIGLGSSGSLDYLYEKLLLAIMNYDSFITARRGRVSLLGSRPNSESCESLCCTQLLVKEGVPRNLLKESDENLKAESILLSLGLVETK